MSSNLSGDLEECFVDGYGLENVGVGDEDGVELETVGRRDNGRDQTRVEGDGPKEEEKEGRGNSRDGLVLLEVVRDAQDIRTELPSLTETEEEREKTTRSDQLPVPTSRSQLRKRKTHLIPALTPNSLAS